VEVFLYSTKNGKRGIMDSDKVHGF